MSKFTYPSFARAQVLQDAPLFYCSFKGTHPGWKGLVNRGIRGLDKAIYSHTEIAVGHPFEAAALCVSSVGVDGGVRRHVTIAAMLKRATADDLARRAA